MGNLKLNTKPISSVFGLLGDKENDISFSVAWALSKCHVFLKEFIKSILHQSIDSDEVDIRLQHHEKHGGITDIELESLGKFFVIIEAKRGWNLPGKDQLQKYGKRKSFLKSNAQVKKMVILSDCRKENIGNMYEYKYIDDLKAEILSWEDVLHIARHAKQTSSHVEKRLLNELIIYLREVVRMQDIDSNWVFVVALSDRVPKGCKISYLDIVKEKGRYFHVLGVRGWPKVPPNYIAFRYHGKLQSIHKIEGYDVVRNMGKHIKGIPAGDWREDYFLYKLGKPFAPTHEVRTGGIYANGRVWCMLDTLFTSKTIKQARDISKRRERE